MGSRGPSRANTQGRDAAHHAAARSSASGSTRGRNTAAAGSGRTSGVGDSSRVAQDPESRFEEVVDEEEAGGPDAGHGSLSM
jgi:hypothetical protein